MRESPRPTHEQQRRDIAAAVAAYRKRHGKPKTEPVKQRGVGSGSWRGQSISEFSSGIRRDVEVAKAKKQTSGSKMSQAERKKLREIIKMVEGEKK